MNPITVMITGLGGGGNGEQILKALKLSAISYKIVGTDMSPFSKGLMEVDYPYIVPPATDPDYIATLLYLCKKHAVQALFHGSEPELKVISKHRQKFIDQGIFVPMNPENVIELCMDKSQTMDWLKENGFHYPETYTIESMEDLNKIEFLPAVLKPSIGGGGSSNLFLAQTKEELRSFGEYLLTICGQFIVQEYVGTPDSEYTVGVLCDMEGNLINSIAVKRYILSGLSGKIKVANKSGNAELGNVLAISSGCSQGEIGKFPDVTKQCEKIATKLGCTGAINIQCRYVNGKAYIFEINPRFSGTTSLRAMVGYNEPDALIRKYILHENIPVWFEYASGHIVRGLSETFIPEDQTFPKAMDEMKV